MKNWKKIEDTLSDLFKKLEHSLALQKLCPIAFEHGTCKAGWRTDENREPIFEIVRADGSTITFPFDEVPDFFKLEEAAKRGITEIPSRFRHNDPVAKEIQKFLRMRVRRRLSER